MPKKEPFYQSKKFQESCIAILKFHIVTKIYKYLFYSTEILIVVIHLSLPLMTNK